MDRARMCTFSRQHLRAERERRVIRREPVAAAAEPAPHPTTGEETHLVGQLADVLLHVPRAAQDFGEGLGARRDAGKHGPPHLGVRVVLQDQDVGFGREGRVRQGQAGAGRGRQGQAGAGRGRTEPARLV